MSAPFAGGSQPMPGQWPEPNSHQNSYDSSMSVSAPAGQRSQNAPQHSHSHMAPQARQLTDPMNPSYAQTRDAPSLSGYQTSPHMTLDTRGPSSQLSAEERPGGAARRPSASRLCAKCGNSLSGQFVRALDATYHLECFTCHVSHC